MFQMSLLGAAPNISGPLPLEQNDDWQRSRRHMSLESLAQISKPESKTELTYEEAAGAPRMPTMRQNGFTPLDGPLPQQPPSRFPDRNRPAAQQGRHINKRGNMFIVSLNYNCALEEVDKHLDAHIEYLKREYANGSFIASGRKIPRTGGIILSNAKSKDELKMILAEDPFSKAGIAEYEITEFFPSMVAEGYEILQR